MNRICYRYKDEEFIELPECERESVGSETCEQYDLYELYKKLNEKLSEITQKPIESENRRTIKFQTQTKGEINKGIPLNFLLKGVPGTGKSRLINQILKDELKIISSPENILRINIHSAITNAELMQGIGISTTKEGNILYLEKEGLVLNHIKKAILYPKQPFVLILEEIQENSLNELIGDLIYLIEEDKRTDLEEVIEKATDEGIDFNTINFNDITELVEFLIEKGLIDRNQYIEIPYLVENKTEYRPLIFPKNLYVFCTSNYREDKKIMEDNLLRRFAVLELYPKKEVVPEVIKDFFEKLNNSILETLKEEIHPDRYLIGHAIFLNVNDKKTFAQAMIKVLTEFKDLKELEFETVKEILNGPLKLIKDKISEGNEGNKDDNKFLSFSLEEIENLINAENYKELTDIFQNLAYKNLIDK